MIKKKPKKNQRAKSGQRHNAKYQLYKCPLHLCMQANYNTKRMTQRFTGPEMLTCFCETSLKRCIKMSTLKEGKQQQQQKNHHHESRLLE